MPHIISDKEYRDYRDFKSLGMTPAQLRETIDNYEAMFDPSPLPLNLNEEEQKS